MGCSRHASRCARARSDPWWFVNHRDELRRNLAWTALVVLLCSVVASIRERELSRAAVRPACRFAADDSVRLARFAIDTIATLRGRSQRIRSFTPGVHGLEVRTDDVDSLTMRN